MIGHVSRPLSRHERRTAQACGYAIAKSNPSKLPRGTRSAVVSINSSPLKSLKKSRGRVLRLRAMFIVLASLVQAVFSFFKTQRELALENLGLRHQIGVLKRTLGTKCVWRCCIYVTASRNLRIKRVARSGQHPILRKRFERQLERAVVMDSVDQRSAI